MSKKKATMTLKDFHGGSIPSDLPLPSAPGVIVRPPERGGFDRQMSWGNSMGSSNQQLRPASANVARYLDDKTPFLRHSAHIGLNFEEDERKPLERISGPHQSFGDESIRAQPNRIVEPKMNNLSGTRVGSMTVPVPVSQFSSGTTSGSNTKRLSELHNGTLNNQNFNDSGSFGSTYPIMGVSARQAVAGSHPNAWGLRKETASLKQPISAAWSTPDAATKLAHASALEKVSSGRWNPRPHAHPQRDAVVFGHLDTEAEFQFKANNIYDKSNYKKQHVGGGNDDHDAALVMHAERSLAVGDGICRGRKEMPNYGRAKSNIHMESHDRSPAFNANGFQSLRHTEKSGGTECQSVMPSESSERPKLTLLPRSKPLENLEPPIDCQKGYQQPSDHSHVEDMHAVNHPTNLQSSFAGSAVGNHPPQRPKLNLKPKSRSHDLLEGNTEVKRSTVFGRARPREVVLKERGIDDVAVSNYDSQPPFRVKEDTVKADASSMLVTHASYSEKAENSPVEESIAKYNDSRDHQLDGGKVDSKRRNRRNELWRNNRELEKHRHDQQPQLQDRPRSPETWRKPVENLKPASPHAPLHYGKAVSAVELAQSFSKSVSDPALSGRFSGPAGLPSHGQMPFSRLMSPTPRHQINGY